MIKKAEKYYYTLKYLKPVQIKYLLKNRLESGKKAVTEVQAPTCGHLPLWISRLDEHPDYQKRFALEEILNGQVTLLYEKGEPGGKNWVNPDKSHLWNFNLHYLEFLIPVAVAWTETKDVRYYERFRDYCRRWIEDNRDGTGDGWHPYTISLRLTNLWICLDAFGDTARKDKEFFQELNDSMYAQYQHLQKKLELHLLGNHYFENLKAVMLGSSYFKEQSIYDDYKSRFQKEIAEQILPDGVHYERSLMYHKIILEDLMRTAKGIQATDRIFYQKLLAVIQKMADAMYSLEEGMGHTPLFNDSGDNVARSMVSLLAALQEEFQIIPKYQKSFEHAGYYCLSDNVMKLILDSGEIAPDYMPGHGHCDGLSFELSWKGQPVFVNSGTGQYQGELRSYFRSTKAHNTVVIDRKEQSQCWGEHRVSKRITDVSGQQEGNRVHGSLTTCTGRRQGRTMELQDHTLEIWDQVNGYAQAYFHLAPAYHYMIQDRKVLVKDAEENVVCVIRGMKTDKLQIHREGDICAYAPEFGKIEKIEVLEIAWNGDGTEHGIQMIFR